MNLPGWEVEEGYCRDIQGNGWKEHTEWVLETFYVAESSTEWEQGGCGLR